MNRSTRLLTLLKIDEAKEREMAKEFAAHRRIFDNKTAKLAELEGYLGEYNLQLSDLLKAGTQVEKLRSCYTFIGHLNNGISQQRLMVSESKRDMDKSRHRWLEAKQRVDILHKTIDKMAAMEMQKERNMEQSIADESSRHKFNQSS